MLEYLLARLFERTTWLGILAILSAAGVGLSPEHQDTIVTAGTAIAGAILSFTRG